MSAWNKNLLVGQKPALKPSEVWSIRTRLQVAADVRGLLLFNLAIDSKLRGCDLVRLKVNSVAAAGEARERAVIVQRKTGRPVQFEITKNSRTAIQSWIAAQALSDEAYLFPGTNPDHPHLSTRQYSRLVSRWVASIGLDFRRYGTHSMRRTKASQIYQKTGNIRAVQLLLGHSKLESTVRYLGIEIDDAISLSEQLDL